jgi:prophage maintenance system killer protein
LPGIRDENVLESALARLQQKWHDAAATDVPTLAAAYADGDASEESLACWIRQRIR